MGISTVFLSDCFGFTLFAQIINVLASDQGEYTCIATNELGIVASESYLTVLSKSTKCFEYRASSSAQTVIVKPLALT